MATDRTIPGSQTPEGAEQTETVIPSSTALKDRYLTTRGLEDSSNFHIGSKNGRNFAQFSTTPESDAWTLAVVDSGTRYEMGIRPDATGTLAEYALARNADGTLVDDQARVEFGSYLDRKYPEPAIPTETIVDVVRGDPFQLLPSADAKTYMRSEAIALADSARVEGPHLSFGRGSVGTRSRAVGGEDDRIRADDSKGATTQRGPIDPYED